MNALAWGQRWGGRLAIAAAIALAVWGYFRERSRQIDDELRERAARIAVLQSQVDTLVMDTLRLRRAIDSLALRYRADTADLARWRTRWWEVAHAPPRVDTVPVHDTVPMAVLVAVADSTIGACTQALHTCDLRVDAERARGDNAEERTKILTQVVDSLAHPPQKPLWYRATKRVGESWALWRGMRIAWDALRRR